MNNFKPNNYWNIKIFSVKFFKNETDQWKNFSKKKLYDVLSNNNQHFKITLPNINYKAPFVSESCKF